MAGYMFLVRGYCFGVLAKCVGVEVQSQTTCPAKADPFDVSVCNRHPGFLSSSLFAVLFWPSCVLHNPMLVGLICRNVLGWGADLKIDSTWK